MELMIDFETLGQDPECVVISIGACCFDLDQGKIGPTFYMAIDVDGQLKDGRKVDASTLRWWMQQSDAAKKVFHEQAKPIKDVMTLFSQWVTQQGSISKIKPWGNGSTFDISIIENIFRQYGIKCPWLYYSVMDQRTFKRFVAGGAKVEKAGVNHNALDDAVSQANYVIEHYKAFNLMIAHFKELAKANPDNYGKQADVGSTEQK